MNIGDYLPSLTALILTNNKVTLLSEIDHLSSLRKIETLSFLDNPVSMRANYRLYAIHRLPSLKMLDYRKVSQKERQESKAFFESAAGKAIETAGAAEGKGSSGATGGGVNGVAVTLTEEQKRLVRQAIEAATTKEQIDTIERKLKVLKHLRYSKLRNE